MTEYCLGCSGPVRRRRLDLGVDGTLCKACSLCTLCGERIKTTEELAFEATNGLAWHIECCAMCTACDVLRSLHEFADLTDESRVCKRHCATCGEDFCTYNGPLILPTEDELAEHRCTR